jgi:hypothetical protein
VICEDARQDVLDFLLLELLHLLGEDLLAGQEREQRLLLLPSQEWQPATHPRLPLALLALGCSPALQLVLRHEYFAFGEEGDDCLERRWFEVVEGDEGEEFLVGDVGLLLGLDDELDDLLPPADHLHLLFGEVKAHVVVDQPLFLLELGEGDFERLLHCGLPLHK